ncbi:two pore domain potassium channel family protein [Sulfitobacter sp. JBTF-M27]|uniref:Two pore domain potassium channel family protein n=1 Tax=Sulfitobacter sediminilitoris TaxID=2698830 RepID=A0A6P0CH43_9RHOB|nr:ion channel [Sulfitobacter sediminilitoris]NEK24700.1 two pore domain potassium channel family protein [Sulfitobacter sediminilitoris]
MPVAVQIALGSALLIICATIHISVAMVTVAWLRAKQPLRHGLTYWSGFKTISALFLFLLFSHTVQIYVWAFTFWASGALQGYEAPIYFSLVTYTTLGYGDITLTETFRILGAMASVCGILMFGLTTAFLVGVIARLLGTKP